MQTEQYLLLSAALVGIGVGSALSHRNLIAFIMSIMTAGIGILVATATIDFRGHGVLRRTDGTLFALCLGSILFVLLILGCAIAYRRYRTSKTININEENQLRH